MDVEILIADRDLETQVDLVEWLSGEDELRGRVREVRGPIGDTELGSVTEVLVVALGSGGAGTVLASSLITWLQTRRTKAKITVKSRKGSVTLDIETIGSVEPLLERILHAGDEH